MTTAISPTNDAPAPEGPRPAAAEIAAAVDAFLASIEPEREARRQLDEHDSRDPDPGLSREETGAHYVEAARLALVAVTAEWARNIAEHRACDLIIAACPEAPVYRRGEFTIVAYPQDAPLVIDHREG